MRDILLIIRGNIRKNKGSYIGIAVMMFLVSLTMTAILSVVVNADKRDKKLMEKSGMGHVLAAMSSNWQQEDYLTEDREKYEKLAEEIRACEDVARVDVLDVAYLNVEDLNGKSHHSTTFVFDYNTPGLDFNIYDGDGNPLKDFTLNAGEIIVPISFKALFNCNIGDVISLSSGATLDVDENGEPVLHKYKVAAFLEDPYMGSSVMGVKIMFISTEDMNNFVDNGLWGVGTFLSIFKDEASTLTDAEFDTMLNRETGYASNTFITITRTQCNVYMTMMLDIFSVILVIFVVMIIVATMIVLSHSISSSIEQDFVNLGILKALGVGNGKIKLTFVLGYLTAALVGAILGVPLAIPLTSVITGIITPTIGLYGDGALQLLLCLSIIVAIFVLFALFMVVKLRKVSKISPVRAINSSKEKVHFSKLFKLPISKKFLGSSLAYRSISSGKKQYVGVVLITAILVFFMVTMTQICMWFSAGGENVADSFATVKYDMSLYAKGEDVYSDAKSIILKHDPEAEPFLWFSQYIVMDDTQICAMVCDEPERFRVYEGRSCTEPNEVLITEFIVDNYGIDIGDTITLNIDGGEDEFTVTGYFICGADAGKTIGISQEEYGRVADLGITEGSEEEVVTEIKPEDYTYNVCFDLSDKSKLDAIISEINGKYSEEEALAEEVDYLEGADAIIIGVYSITIVIYVIAGIFIAVTIVMVCSKMFAKEKQDNGVYKAIGLTSAKLRSTFATRFAIIAVIGSLIGIVLVFFFAEPLVGIVFEMFGYYTYEQQLGLVAIVLPVIFMGVTFYIFAKLSSRKMKKLSPRILINE